ncbi:MAG: tetratricopeptide repeat protein [Candidatus Margulisbacteria bacterium]|nr:tetratricopeptide repeat protein [Candidatus Margulisiibacteriota bacterium]
MKKNIFFLIIVSSMLICTTSILNAATPAENKKASEELRALDEQKMMLDALRSFVENDPQAADEMEYIIRKREDVAREKANKLLEQMAVTTPDAKQAELNMGELDFVSRKLNMALVYFYETKYYLTIQECNNVLKVDAKNTLAWIRRGSGYYMLQNYEQAKKDWEIAIKLTPTEEQRVDLAKYLTKISSQK